MNFREHLLKRKNVIRIARVIGKLVVKRGAVSIGHRDSGRCSTEAFPEQLDQPKSLFNGQSQNLGNVGIAHTKAYHHVFGKATGDSLDRDYAGCGAAPPAFNRAAISFR